MSNRKLASIQNIVELIPITGKDKIVLATLCNGWKVIVSKDNYKLYDIVVYFEIDSILQLISKKDTQSLVEYMNCFI